MRAKPAKVQPRYGSIKDAAAYWDVTDRTIVNRIREGTLPAVRLGSGPKARIRIAWADIESLGETIPSAGRTAS